LIGPIFGAIVGAIVVALVIPAPEPGDFLSSRGVALIILGVPVGAFGRGCCNWIDLLRARRSADRNANPH
jgi:hypothetical protein